MRFEGSDWAEQRFKPTTQRAAAHAGTYVVRVSKPVGEVRAFRRPDRAGADSITSNLRAPEQRGSRPS